MTDKEKLDYIALLYYNHLTSGDDNIDEAMEFFEQEGLIDSDGDWIYEDEDDN